MVNWYSWLVRCVDDVENDGTVNEIRIVNRDSDNTRKLRQWLGILIAVDKRGEDLGKEMKKYRMKRRVSFYYCISPLHLVIVG